MIRTKIDGREATVSYLLRDFTPVDEDKAELIKIVFDDDGETSFIVPDRVNQ